MTAPAATVNALTDRRLMIRNTVINLLGQGSPGLVALLTVPLLVRGLGTDRFGALALIWVTINYFNLLDLGLGRALVKLVADRLGGKERHEIAGLAGTALLLMAGLGVVGAIVLGVGAPWLVARVLHVPAGLAREMERSFLLIALSLPLVLTASGLRGMLEAYQRFDLVNAVRIPLTLFTFVGPVLVLPFSRSLVAVAVILVAARVIAWAAQLALCLRYIPDLSRGFSVRLSGARPLLRFAGWLGVSNVIGPLLLYIDRFFLAAMVSVAAVAYYTTPFEVVTQLWFVPRAVVEVLFPALGVLLVAEPGRAGRLYGRAMLATVAILLPICLLILLFARPGLALWLGPDFAANSTLVAQILAIGLLVNSIGLVATAVIQAADRPDLTAKLHMIELPLYVVYLPVLIQSFGWTGAAFAWLLRVTLSAVILTWLARRCLRRRADGCRDGVTVPLFAPLEA